MIYATYTFKDQLSYIIIKYNVGPTLSDKEIID